MTDLEKFIALYASFGITLKAGPRDPPLPCHASEMPRREYVTQSVLLNGHPMFVGYSGFYGEAFFDADGAFVGQGFWE